MLLTILSTVFIFLFFLKSPFYKRSEAINFSMTELRKELSFYLSKETFKSLLMKGVDLLVAYFYP